MSGVRPIRTLLFGWPAGVILLVLGSLTSTLLTQVLPNCSQFNFDPASPPAFPSSGGTGIVTCSKGPISGGVYTGCAWTATSNDSWIRIDSGQQSSSSGSGIVRYTVLANPGSSDRTGTVTFSSGQYNSAIYSITQSGGTAPPPPPPPPGDLSGAPTALYFYNINGLASGAQTFRLTSTGSAINLLAAVSTDDGGNWLRVSPGTGTTPVTFSVSVDVTGLANPVYSGRVRINDAGSGATLATVPVSLVYIPPSSRLTVPLLANIRYSTDSKVTPQTLVLPVTAPRNARIFFTATSTSPLLSIQSGNPFGNSFNSLLGPNAPAASISELTPTTLKVSIDTEKLAQMKPGTYVATIRYTIPDPVESVSQARAAEGASGCSSTPAGLGTAIVIAVGPSTNIIGPDQLSFDDDTQFPRALDLLGKGTVKPDLFFLKGPDSWLSLDPCGPATLKYSYDVAVNRAGLASDSYSALAAFSEVDNQGSKVVKVNLRVGSGMAVDQSSLAFSAELNGPPPPPQYLAVTGGNGRASIRIDGASDWLSVPSSIPLPGVIPVSLKRVNSGDDGAATTIVIETDGALSVSIPVGVTVSNPVPPRRQLFPLLISGPNVQTSLVLVNYDAEKAAEFRLNFLNSEDGLPLFLPVTGSGRLSNYPGRIEPNGSTTIVIGTDPTSRQGWAELVTTSAIGGQLVVRQQASGTVSQASAALTLPANHRFMVPFDLTDDRSNTRIFLINPGSAPAAVRVQARGPGGTELAPAQSTPTIRARAQIVVDVRALFPDAIGSTGMIEFSAVSSELSGMALQTKFNLFGSVPIFTEQDLAVGARRRLIPHFLRGGDSQWDASVTVFNADPESASAYLSFYNDSGNSLIIPTTAGSGSFFSASLAGGGSTTFSTDHADSAQGWIDVNGGAGIGGFASFHATADTGQFFVPMIAGPIRSFLLPYSAQAGAATQIALVNPQPQDTTVSVIFRDESGVEFDRQSISIAARGHRFDTLVVPAGSNGVIEFSSESGILALGLTRDSTGSVSLSYPIPR